MHAWRLGSSLLLATVHAGQLTCGHPWSLLFPAPILFLKYEHYRLNYCTGFVWLLRTWSLVPTLVHRHFTHGAISPAGGLLLTAHFNSRKSRFQHTKVYFRDFLWLRHQSQSQKKCMRNYSCYETLKLSLFLYPEHRQTPCTWHWIIFLLLCQKHWNKSTWKRKYYLGSVFF